MASDSERLLAEFNIRVRVHTIDCLRVLTDPEVLRNELGVTLDGRCNLQEEIDYTLVVTRVHSYDGQEDAALDARRRNMANKYSHLAPDPSFEHFCHVCCTHHPLPKCEPQPSNAKPALLSEKRLNELLPQHGGVDLDGYCVKELRQYIDALTAERDELKRDIETGFMEGAYARLKQLQTAEYTITHLRHEVTKPLVEVLEDCRAILPTQGSELCVPVLRSAAHKPRWFDVREKVVTALAMARAEIAIKKEK